MFDEIQNCLDDIQSKLKALKYTDKERNFIIDATNKQFNKVYNKTDNRFVDFYISSPFFRRNSLGC